MRHQPLSLTSGFHLHSDGRHLDLIWHRRRVKIISEYPSTLLLYDLLLRLIAHRVGLTPRYVTCHAECWVLSEVGRGVQQVSRNTSPPPTVEIDHQDQFAEYRAEDFSISESKRSSLSSL
jgi:thymidylate synthase